MLSSALELLGPPACVGCGRRAGILCPVCSRSLPSRPAMRALPGIVRCVAAWPYDGPARSLVLALKLHANRPAAVPLAEAMARAAQRAGLEAAVVAPVPGRARDIRERGFDHADLLARTLAPRLGLRVVRILERRSRTTDQAGLAAAARWQNLDGAFLARPYPVPVLLVDDVVTTGATAVACARALRDAGAPSVEVLAACGA